MDTDASSSTVRGRTHILVVEYNIPKFSRAKKKILACIFFIELFNKFKAYKNRKLYQKTRKW